MAPRRGVLPFLGAFLVFALAACDGDVVEGERRGPGDAFRSGGTGPPETVIFLARDIGGEPPPPASATPIPRPRPASVGPYAKLPPCENCLAECDEGREECLLECRFDAGLCLGDCGSDVSLCLELCGRERHCLDQCAGDRGMCDEGCRGGLRVCEEVCYRKTAPCEALCPCVGA